MNRQATAERQLVGERLGHYHILEKIGAGGMGEVYRARDEIWTGKWPSKFSFISRHASANGIHGLPVLIDFGRSAF